MGVAALSDDRELAGLCGRAWEVRHDHAASVKACAAIVDWWDARSVRWLEVLEARRRERLIAFLSELDELEREIEARLRGRVAA